jgi:hypothetical protein
MAAAVAVVLQVGQRSHRVVVVVAPTTMVKPLQEQIWQAAPA